MQLQHEAALEIAAQERGQREARTISRTLRTQDSWGFIGSSDDTSRVVQGAATNWQVATNFLPVVTDGGRVFDPWESLREARGDAAVEAAILGVVNVAIGHFGDGDDDGPRSVEILPESDIESTDVPAGGGPASISSSKLSDVGLPDILLLPPDQAPIAGDVERATPSKQSEVGHAASEKTIKATTSHDGKAPVTISGNPKKKEESKKPKDGGDDGDGDNLDDRLHHGQGGQETNAGKPVLQDPSGHANPASWGRNPTSSDTSARPTTSGIKSKAKTNKIHDNKHAMNAQVPPRTSLVLAVSFF